MIKTKIDDIIRLLKDKKKLTIDEIAHELALDTKSVEKIAQILDKAEVVKLVYPINVVARPWIEIKEIKKEEQLAQPTGNLIDEYNISGLKGHASGNVKIVLSDVDKRPMYFISAPQISYATRIYFDAIKDEISKLTPIEQREIVREDIEKGFDMRHSVIASVLQKDIAPEKKVLDVLCGILLREMYGLGEIEILIADDLLEEVIINSSHQPIAVYHRKYGWLKTNIQPRTEEEVENYASQIARKIGKQISLLNPILDAHLISGDRVNSTLFPISTIGNTITLRLFARNPWTIVGFLDKENRVLTVEMAALLWQAVHYEMNVLISGGTASGKCVSGDTDVIAEEKITKIKDIVEETLKEGPTSSVDGFETAPCKLSVLSFNPNTMKIERKIASRVWKKKTNRLIAIKTQTGKEIQVTPEHPFFKFDFELLKVRADNLNVGSFIAVPRQTQTNETEIFFDLKKLSGIQIQNEKYHAIAYTSRSIPISIPYKLDKQLARIIGFLIGDGHISKDREKIAFFNADKELLSLFKKDVGDVFGIEAKIRKYGHRVSYVLINSVILKDFFTKIIGIPAGKKSYDVKIPSEFLNARKEIIAEMIKALFESEGYVGYKKGELEFTSASKQLVKDISFILQRFGIINRLSFKKGKNRLFIAGKHLQDFNEKIGLITTTKRAAILKARKRTFSPNFDFIPGIGKALAFLKDRLKLYEKEMCGSLSREAVARYVCNKRNPTKESLSEVLFQIEKRSSELKDLKKDMNNIEDPIKTKKELLELIKYIRNELGINRKELAKESGIDITSIYHWEKGNFIPYNEKITILGNTIARMIESCEAEKPNENDTLMLRKGEIEKKIYEINVSTNEVIEKARKILKIDNQLVKPSKLLTRIKNELEIACSEEVEGCIKNLRLLVSSDILWDKIVEIKEITNEDQFVYDLTVDEHHTFIANNMIVHNTSALNAVVSLIPNFQRVVSIEDTRELALPSYQWNWIPLVTRPSNPEGLGEITMLDLVVNALRMRPDRIVMGEIRRKHEAEVLFEAMHTGHSVYATMHADTGAQVIKRLIEPPIEIPPSEVEDVHLIMVQYRDRRKNIRRTLEISEVALGPSGPELNHIYNWRPRVDQFQLVRPPRRYIEQMNLHTGMTEKEVNEDQEEKKSILNWMFEQRLHQIEDVGAIMKIYYGDKDSLLKAVEKKLSPSKVI